MPRSAAAVKASEPTKKRKTIALARPPRRDVTKLIAMTAEEKDEMEAAARRAGLPLTSWIRNTCLRMARGEVY